MLAGRLVDMIVINGNLFQFDNATHFLQNIRIVEYIGLFQTVLIEDIKKHIAFEIDPDFFKGVVLICVILMGGAGLQKVDIVGLQGVGMAVYTQITFAGDDVFQYKISVIGAEDMEIGVGISDAEALNGQGNFGGTVVDIGQHLIL